MIDDDVIAGGLATWQAYFAAQPKIVTKTAAPRKTYEPAPENFWVSKDSTYPQKGLVSLSGGFGKLLDDILEMRPTPMYRAAKALDLLKDNIKLGQTKIFITLMFMGKNPEETDKNKATILEASEILGINPASMGRYTACFIVPENLAPNKATAFDVFYNAALALRHEKEARCNRPVLSR